MNDLVVSSWISPKAIKGAKSEVAGLGLVAELPIEKDEIVAVKGGHVITASTLSSLSERLQNSSVQISDDHYIAALVEGEYDPVMLYLNHSCEPNVGFGGNIVLLAMRDILAGEELPTDYALFDDYKGSMECHCGRPTCRHRIDGQDWKRPELQERYRGYFSWYLARRIGSSKL